MLAVEGELPRVRVQALRTLGAVGDTEHVDVVRELLDDENQAVRRQAARSLTQLARRLDLDVDDLVSRRRAGQSNQSVARSSASARPSPAPSAVWAERSPGDISVERAADASLPQQHVGGYLDGAGVGHRPVGRTHQDGRLGESVGQHRQGRQAVQQLDETGLRVVLAQHGEGHAEQ